LERNRPEKPESLDAPGLTRQRRSNGLGVRWDLYWKAGASLAKRGFKPVTARLWFPSEGQDNPTPDEWNGIAAECRALQAKMLTWGGEIEGDTKSIFDGTFGSLIKIYKTDPDSSFKEVRYKTRLGYTSKLNTLDFEVGNVAISALTFRDFKKWHKAFLLPEGETEDHVARAHGLMTMVRIVITFGKLCDLPDCARLAAILADMEFKTPRRRKTFLTLAQVEAFIAEAHRQKMPSLALAQAIMFETSLRQKDVIGEWVPIAEPGASDIHWRGRKWIMGARWSDINEHLILTKIISKSIRGKHGVETWTGNEEEFDLKAYPLVMRELHNGYVGPRGARRDICFGADLVGRNAGAAPLIINENTKRPWSKSFSDVWR
jgi:hypothetical protein